MFGGSISIAGLEVVQSGSVVSAAGQPLVFQPFPRDSFKLEVVFDPDEKAERRIDVITTEHGAKWHVKGFNNPLGTGVTEPIKIANHGKRPLFFMLASYVIGEIKSHTRVTVFTFLLGAENAS